MRKDYVLLYLALKTLVLLGVGVHVGVISWESASVFSGASLAMLASGLMAQA